MTWEELSTSTPGDILAWADDQPWCRAMARCRQDEGWHAEGDVWTHTKLVCAQLPGLEAWPDLDLHDQTVLLFTALFHDAGKPMTSQVDSVTGRITSPKHAVKSEHLARSVLRELGCDFTTREEIARLVRFHGRPAHLLEKPEPGHEVISLSWLVSNRLLYSFALADSRGRTTAEMGRPEEDVHLWRLVAEEHGCYDRPYPFANDQARFLFYRQDRPNPHYVPYEAHRFTVTMMSGLPGSGKDAWLAANRPDLPVVSMDDIRGDLQVDPTDDQGAVIQTARARCREFLRSGRSFAFNATNVLRQTRRRWIDLFAGYDARIEVVTIEPPLPVILDRNRRRERPVPETVILGLADKCEPPTWTEAHGLTFICEGAVASNPRPIGAKPTTT
jgi:predicted kinase